jgi:hypothetical protein
MQNTHFINIVLLVRFAGDLVFYVINEQFTAETASGIDGLIGHKRE